MTHTVTTWIEDHLFESVHEGNAIRVDGDKTRGHGPKALLLSGLAGCSGVDIIDILTKMRVAFSDLVITVSAPQTTENPKIFRDITIKFRLKTDKENEPKVRKAIELSLEKYCGVSAMLRKNSAINYKLEIH